ncbi:MAG: heme peroxidase family protein [Anaerolineae bacterium]|nr:heme peroxidase family protein [Anaerolineae bacterium]
MTQINTQHGALPRGLEHLPHSRSYAGRFGRMFRNLPALEITDDLLATLSETMFHDPENDQNPAEDPLNNLNIPSGYTYLGQFIDHDLTFDPTSKLQRQNDPDALQNFRTPRFDLDLLYGSGPADSPFLYKNDGSGLLLLSESGHDLPRNSESRALIGDPRNDENQILSQLHVIFIKFHNKIIEQLKEQLRRSSKANVFEQAREIVRWHYQWIVITDFLKKIVGCKLVESILSLDEYKVASGDGILQQAINYKADLKFYEWRNDPYMPVEFSAAAYRFGHSMVRSDYALNNHKLGENGAAELPVFYQNAKGDDAKDLRGRRKLADDRVINWERFFNLPGQSTPNLQASRKIDTRLAEGLMKLPTTVAIPISNATESHKSSLAYMNLLRGKALGLPSGQAVARAMGIPKALILSSTNDFGFKSENSKLNAIKDQTPLWYYILKEAELICDGKQLGPIGGRIVAEVFIGLLVGDKTSFLNVDPGWKPQKGEFGCDEEGNYSMSNLINFVNSNPSL